MRVVVTTEIEIAEKDLDVNRIEAAVEEACRAL